MRSGRERRCPVDEEGMAGGGRPGGGALRLDVPVRTVRRMAFGAMAAALACGAPPVPGTAGPAAAQQTGATDLIPAGLGTLKIDDATISLRSGPLLVKVTPLAEQVIRLLAPDSYERLHNIAEPRRDGAAAATHGQPAEMFLVSFFSYQADVEFQPEDLQASHRGRLMRPATILPVTPGWGRQRLAQQTQQVAVYVFEGPIDYEQPVRMQYGATNSDMWSRIIPVLEVERTRVRAKAGGG